MVGIKDEMAGEKPKAFVVLSAAARVKIGQDPEQLRLKQTEIFDFMKDQTIRYKHLSGGVDFINVCLLRSVALDSLIPRPSGSSEESIGKDTSSNTARSSEHEG